MVIMHAHFYLSFIPLEGVLVDEGFFKVGSSLPSAAREIAHLSVGFQESTSDVNLLVFLT